MEMYKHRRGNRRSHRYAFGSLSLKVAGPFHDHRGILTSRDLPAPSAVCHVLSVDVIRGSGPTQQIPGTPHTESPLPTINEEPAWMKLSTV